VEACDLADLDNCTFVDDAFLHDGPQQLKRRKMLINFQRIWKDNVESTDVRVNMNKTKVVISGECQKVMQKLVRWPCRSVVEVLVVI